jgi:hypothetical protein
MNCLSSAIITSGPCKEKSLLTLHYEASNTFNGKSQWNHNSTANVTQSFSYSYSLSNNLQTIVMNVDATHFIEMTRYVVLFVLPVGIKSRLHIYVYCLHYFTMSP